MRIRSFVLLITFLLAALITPVNQSYTHAQGDSDVLFGPEDGELEWPLDYVIGGVNIRDFTLRLRLYNPYAASRGLWVFAVAFRTNAQTANNGYVLIMASTGQWIFARIVGSGQQTPLGNGNIDGYNTSASGSNEIEITINGESGSFSVNGRRISSIDVSGYATAGDIVVLAGASDSDSPEGAVARYEGLTIAGVNAATVASGGNDSGDSAGSGIGGSDGSGSASAAASDCTVTANGRVFLRELPVEFAPIIVSIPAGTQMDGLAQYNGAAWVQVTYGGQIGWIVNRNINGSGGCADLPAALE